LPAQVDPHGYLVHPALLDACLQVTAAALGEHTPHAWLPVRVRRYRLLRADEPITQLHVHAVARGSSEGNGFVVNISATDAEGRHVLTVDALQLRRIERKPAEPQPKPKPDRPGAVSPTRVNSAAEIMAWPDGQRQTRMLEHIRGRVAQILESKVNDVPVDRPLDTLGLDSLMAFELREEIKESLGVEISLEVFLQDMTLIDLSNTLTSELYARADTEQKEPLRNDHLLSTPQDEGLIEGAL
jgi:acyl carrier protein